MSEQVEKIDSGQVAHSGGRIVKVASPHSFAKLGFRACCLELIRGGVSKETIMDWLKEL